jgi:hypothetical protein
MLDTPQFIQTETEGFNAQDSLWECYLSGPESSLDPDKWLTELNRPLTL